MHKIKHYSSFRMGDDPCEFNFVSNYDTTKEFLDALFEYCTNANDATLTVVKEYPAMTVGDIVILNDTEYWFYCLLGWKQINKKLFNLWLHSGTYGRVNIKHRISSKYHINPGEFTTAPIDKFPIVIALTRDDIIREFQEYFDTDDSLTDIALENISKEFIKCSDDIMEGVWNLIHSIFEDMKETSIQASE